MLFAPWTISTNTWPRVRIDTRDHSNTSDRPPACCASATTVPLNALTSLGRRTTMRVVYGAPAAVPETNSSSVTYGKASTCGAAGTTLIAGSGYMRPGALTTADTVGNGGVAAPAGATRHARMRQTGTIDFMTRGLWIGRRAQQTSTWRQPRLRQLGPTVLPSATTDRPWVAVSR